MATIAHTPAKRSARQPWPQRRLWTVAEYYRAADTGVFRPDEKLELINGEVIRKVSPQGSKHTTSVERIAEMLASAFGGGAFYIRQEKPLRLSGDNEPEPDVAVIRGHRRDYEDRHPGPADVLLVVEVADKTLAFDRGKKAALYAAAGIPEYWIVNLGQQRIEVHRDPSGLDATQAEGLYKTLTLRTPGETISPLGAPNAAIAVADLLPASSTS